MWSSVHGLTTPSGAAVTRDLGHLNGELVIISELLSRDQPSGRREGSKDGMMRGRGSRWSKDGMMRGRGSGWSKHGIARRLWLY